MAPQGGRRRQQRCTITFASMSALTSLSEREAAGGAPAVAAALLLSGLQLDQAASRRKSQPLLLAWIHAPHAAPVELLDSSATTSSSSSNADRGSEAPQRRFPLPPWARNHSTEATSSSSSSSSKPSGGGSGGGSSSSSGSSGGSRKGGQQQQQQQQGQGQEQQPSPSKNKLRTRRSGENPRRDAGALCIEASNGRERVYCMRTGMEGGRPWEAFDMVDEPQTHHGRFMDLVRSYLLPQGFPDSVAPQYASYMGWRGVQYFFGGAMSVFTTKSLLGALGVAGKHSGEAAAAINWVLKDGAGRLGRFLFARWGRELDCELKQFRLAGDILMEAGAALELSTALAPGAFLPLACTANLAKNLAAVAASSTRAPIYRTFAKSNNLADVTAKGESVANLADILGTLAGIALSKAKLPMVPTFVVLSAGYLTASRMEVDSVELPYLNRARLAYTATRFLATGMVPGIAEANHKEPLLPWGRYHQGKVVLGARVEQACCTPADLGHAAALFKGEKFIMTYRPDTKKVYILLREGAQPMDGLKAAFSAHVFLHMLEQQAAAGAAGTGAAPAASSAAGAAGKPSSSKGSTKPAAATTASGSSSSGSGGLLAVDGVNTTAMIKDTVARLKTLFHGNTDGSKEAVQQLLEGSRVATEQLYSEFKREADRLGWKLGQTMLNPGETRLLKVTQLALA